MGERDATALSDRQLADDFRQRGQLERGCDRVDLVLGDVAFLDERLGNGLSHRQPGLLRHVLEDQIALPGHGSLVGSEVAHHDLEQGGLPGPVGADEPNSISLVNGERNIT
jgi:hypothetical protein